MSDDLFQDDPELSSRDSVRSLDADRLQEPLRTLQLRPPVRVGEDCKLDEAIRKIREAGVGSCLVEDATGRLAGIFTERDLLNKIDLERVSLGEIPVRDFMERDPETLTADHPIAYALNRMAGGGYRNIPLVDDKQRITGLVTLRDIVEDVCDHFPDEVLTLPPTLQAAIAREREGA